MTAIISRHYCRAHPIEIFRLFGLGVLLGVLFDKRKTLVQRVSEKLEKKHIPMPKPLGNAYRVSALLELRVARIYARMSERFRDIEPAYRLFRELQAEEEEHCRVMNICLYAVKMRPSIEFIPSVRDPEIRKGLKYLRQVLRRVPSMSLSEALEVTEGLERGEVNVIFDKLVKQVEQPEARILQVHLEAVEGHAESVPKRIRELRDKLRELGLQTGEVLRRSEARGLARKESDNPAWHFGQTVSRPARARHSSHSRESGERESITH